ncbi:ORFL143C.iORF1 [Human betaherpesvirus 5]|nr:ORFL143C.iORF1 [Human betaherpesvirus 5]QHX40471.1 ORFL143C.iORF1 [Human betaherpesvirus 5]
MTCLTRTSRVVSWLMPRAAPR